MAAPDVPKPSVGSQMLGKSRDRTTFIVGAMKGAATNGQAESSKPSEAVSEPSEGIFQTDSLKAIFSDMRKHSFPTSEIETSSFSALHKIPQQPLPHQPDPQQPHSQQPQSKPNLYKVSSAYEDMDATHM